MMREPRFIVDDPELSCTEPECLGWSCLGISPYRSLLLYHLTAPSEAMISGHSIILILRWARKLIYSYKATNYQATYY